MIMDIHRYWVQITYFCFKKEVKKNQNLLFIYIIIKNRWQKFRFADGGDISTFYNHQSCQEKN